MLKICLFTIRTADQTHAENILPSLSGESSCKPCLWRHLYAGHWILADGNLSLDWSGFTKIELNYYSNVAYYYYYRPAGGKSRRRHYVISGSMVGDRFKEHSCRSILTIVYHTLKWWRYIRLTAYVQFCHAAPQRRYWFSVFEVLGTESCQNKVALTDINDGQSWFRATKL